MTKSLTEKAMMCRLTVRGWSGQKLDRKVSNKVAADHGTSADVGVYYKKLVKSPALDAFWKTTQAARAFQYANTLPWLDNGLRVLPALRFDEYREGISDFKNEAEEWIQKFVANYHIARVEAKENLKGLFLESDYPTSDVMQSKFSFTASVYPLPNGEDWRVDVGDKEVAAIKKQIEADVGQAWQEGLQDIWSRLFTQVEHIHERLNDPDKVFRTTLVTSTEAMIKLLSDLNLNDDPTLNKALQELKMKVTDHGYDKLKGDKKVRADAAKAAKDMLADITKVMA